MLGSFCDHKGRKIKLLQGFKQAERLADKKVKSISLQDIIIENFLPPIFEHKKK